MAASPLDRPPFDLLTPVERARLREAAEPVEYPAGARLGSASGEPVDVWLLLAGLVRQPGVDEPDAHGSDAEAPTADEAAVREPDVDGPDADEPAAREPVAHGPFVEHGPGELIGLREVLAGRSNGRLIAQSPVLALRIPKAALRALIADNAVFAAALFDDLAHALSAGAQRRQRALRSPMMSRVREAWLRKPLVVDAATDLVSLCRLLAAQDVTEALVRDGERIGIFTTTDLREALLRPEPVDRQSVRELAHFEPISVSADAELLEAMLAMLRHRVHRVLVRDGDEVIGILGQLELMSFVSNHSHLIALQIEQAAGLADLSDAAHRVDDLIEMLYADGVRIEVITGLVRELNRKVIARLWSMLAPQVLVENSCLLVMGSEGRGEQIVKTDQDNALLLRDGFEFEGLQEITLRFSAALDTFGYPPCPGGIMLSRPLWCQSLSGFRASLSDWIHGADPDGPMNLAIFLDASAVIGDSELLAQARAHIDRVLADSDAFYARFASAVDRFGESGGWWSRLANVLGRDESEEVDLKKLGIFPVVHGARALALQYRVRDLSTAARLRALAARGRIDEALVRDLIDALHFLIGLKLRVNLHQRRLGQIPDNLVPLATLGTLERDSLKDSLAIVRRFRQWLHRHYRLDSL